MRTCGGQRKRLKDFARHYTKTGQINISTLEDMAAGNGPIGDGSGKTIGRQEMAMCQLIHDLPGTSCPHCNMI